MPAAPGQENRAEQRAELVQFARRTAEDDQRAARSACKEIQQARQLAAYELSGEVLRSDRYCPLMPALADRNHHRLNQVEQDGFEGI